MHLTLGAYLGKVKTQRAAVIPYTILEEGGRSSIYFLLAVDSRTGDITDLGGGVKKYECSLVGGLREFKEETNQIFHEDDYTNVNKMSTYIGAVHNKMSVLFLPVGENWFADAPSLFEKRKKEKRACREVSRIMWIHQDSFEELLESKKMWSRLRSFYKCVYNEKLLELLRFRYDIFIL